MGVEDFKATDRVVYPLDGMDCSQVQTAVAHYLQNRGYTVVDYIQGYARYENGQNIYRIGGLLKHEPLLQYAFRHDVRRVCHKMRVVISGLPEDIARCAVSEGFIPSHIPAYEVPVLIGEGALVACLVMDTDLGATQPLAQILLRPHTSPDGLRVMVPGSCAGLQNQSFVNTVQSFANRHFNAGKFGMFHNAAGQAVTIFNPDMSTQDVLEDCRVAYRREDKNFIVTQDFSLKKKGLTRLPDLTPVHVEGHFDCSENALQNLEGAPQSVGQNFYANDNRLRTLYGGPVIVGGMMYCQGNPLTTLIGQPKDCQTLVLDDKSLIFNHNLSPA